MASKTPLVIASGKVQQLQSGDQLQIFVGSNSAPGLCFSGDTNTGIYSQGADSLDFTTGGTRRATCDANGQWELRSNFSTYTPDGLWDTTNANPILFQGPSGGSNAGRSGIRFGWEDGGSGEYIGSIGFAGGSVSAGTSNPLRIIQTRILYGTPETQNRFEVYFDGKHKWGVGGSTAVDTDLYRSTTSTLRTSSTFIVDTNLGVGQTSFGTNAAKVLAIGNGTPPATSPASAVQLYSANRNGVAGKASLHIVAETTHTHVLGDRVGFFTTNPQYAMQVLVSDNSTQQLVLENDSAGSAARCIFAGIGDTKFFQFGQESSTYGAGEARTFFNSSSTVQAWDFSAVEKLRLNSSGNLGLGVTTFGTSAAGVFAIGDGTAPTSSPANSVQVYSETGKLKVRDAGGTVTILSDLGRGRRNALLNGDINIWQRGTSFTGIATATYSADRWQDIYVTSGVINITRDTDVPTVATSTRLFSYSMKVACTTADSSIAATDLMHLSQRIEGHLWAGFAQQPLVLTFYVKSSKTGIFSVALSNNVDRTYVAEYTINSANTWEKKTVILTASPSAGTWNYTTGIGATLVFSLMAGSNSTTSSLATWNSDLKFASTNQVNFLDSNTATFFLTGVQLEVGATANPFDTRTFQEELTECRRYYWKTFPYATAPAQNVGNQTGAIGIVAPVAASRNSVWVRFPVQMRVSPSVTTYNPSAANANWHNFTTVGDVSVTVTTLSTSEDGFVVATAGTITNAGDLCYVHADAAAEL